MAINTTDLQIAKICSREQSVFSALVKLFHALDGVLVMRLLPRTLLNPWLTCIAQSISQLQHHFRKLLRLLWTKQFHKTTSRGLAKLCNGKETICVKLLKWRAWIPLYQKEAILCVLMLKSSGISRDWYHRQMKTTALLSANGWLKKWAWPLSLWLPSTSPTTERSFQVKS